MWGESNLRYYEYIFLGGYDMHVGKFKVNSQLDTLYDLEVQVSRSAIIRVSAISIDRELSWGIFSGYNLTASCTVSIK